LADHTGAAGAERCAKGDLAGAPGRLSEEQIDEVHGSDEQQTADCAHQNPQCAPSVVAGQPLARGLADEIESFVDVGEALGEHARDA
jgi:hypothetical protein